MNKALKHPLSAHEQLELRLSMPREFWPQKWHDEEALSRAKKAKTPRKITLSKQT